MKILYIFLFLGSLVASEPFVYWQKETYIHIVDVDPSEVEVVIVQSPEGAEPVSSMALHHYADVAINGGFFRKEPYYGAPAGILRIDHTLFSPTDRNRGALGVSNDPSLFSIDRLDEEDHPILSPENAPLWDSFPYILGGTPVLIHNGEKMQNIFEESLPERFVYEKFTRSSIAFLPNGHWLIIFVGQPGMTLYELQDLMLELGAEHALNLDGGSSSTLYYKGRVLSSNPYLERMVGNALLFRDKN